MATNQLLEGKVGELGFVTTEGYEFLLEIARQSVPDGYGNSYFWVKPDRIVPVDRVRTVGGRLDHTGAEVRPFDEAGAVEIARWFKDEGIDTIGVCLLHSYANPAHELRMRDILAAEHPDAVVSLSSRGAARVPRVRAGDDDPGRRRGQTQGGALRRSIIAAGWTALDPDGRDPVLRDAVQRRRAVGRRGGAPADHHRAVRARPPARSAPR